MPMTGTTTGKNLYKELKSLLENLSISLENVLDISTDGTPSIMSVNVGVVELLFNEIQN